MNIWIDGYEANVGQRLGSGQVSFELLRNIEHLDHKNSYTIFLPSMPNGELPQSRPGWEYKILKPVRLWTRIALPLALYFARQKPDLFFSPTHYGPWPCPVKQIVTVFDLSYLHFPKMFKRADLYKLQNWTKDSVHRSSHVITISQSSKKDLINFYHLAKKDITVAYPGYDKDSFYPVSNKDKIDSVLKRYSIESPYVLFIGTIQPRKNLKRLIHAFEKIENLKLVIVGKTTGQGRQAWMYQDILDLPKQLKIESKVIFTGYVPNEDLLYLVNGAKAYVLPSLWEGFGIPAVEAMACGVPVIVSNISSLPEAVGNAGLLVDPTSVDQIEQAIRLISTDKKLWDKKSKQGLAQAQNFSWQKMAKQVIKVFDKVGANA